MKKSILLFVIIIGCISSNAQSLKTLEWWRNMDLLNAFPTDLNTLSYYINHLNDSVIAPIKNDFDSCRTSVPNKQLRIIVKNKIDTQYLDAIKSNVNNIRACNFFYNPEKKVDTSFLYYYTNKELNDYLLSLEAFQVESKKVVSESGSMSVFNNSNFLNAYFNVSISRSLLLAAMDNLERYFLLGSVADEIKESSVSMITSVQEISCRTLLIKDSLDNVNVTAKQSKALLTEKFFPYKPLKSKKYTNLVVKNSDDKISTAANTILIDSRRNWWWRTLIGGVIGGLAAGLLVNVFK